MKRTLLVAAAAGLGVRASHFAARFSWLIPAAADASRFTIEGFLGYSPPEGSGDDDGAVASLGPLALAGPAIVGAAVAAVPLLILRRRPANRA